MKMSARPRGTFSIGLRITACTLRKQMISEMKTSNRVSKKSRPLKLIIRVRTEWNIKRSFATYHRFEILILLSRNVTRIKAFLDQQLEMVAYNPRVKVCCTCPTPSHASNADFGQGIKNDLGIKGLYREIQNSDQGCVLRENEVRYSILPSKSAL